MINFFRKNIALFIGILTIIFFKSGGDSILSPDTPMIVYIPASIFLLSIVTWAIFSVVHHSDALAIKLGDPYGTLILTLSVILLEVVMISSVMLTGDPNPVMARDTMFAVFMIIANGLVGISLLIGGKMFHIQKFNIHGVKSYLVAIIPISIICMILPNYTVGGSEGSLSTAMSVMLVVITLGLYAVFLITQTKSHTDFFIDEKNGDDHDHMTVVHSNLYHTLLLIAHLVVVIILAKILALPINHTVSILGAPAAIGGFIVACIVLAPEAVGAVKATRNNQLQRAMNLYFGSILATIALTVPAILTIAAFTGDELRLGLEIPEMILLVTTLMVCKLTFSSGRTHSLYGVTHLLLFVVYIFLIFDAGI